MGEYKCVKRIESEDGLRAIEVLQHPEGHAQYRIFQRASVKGPSPSAPSGNPWMQVEDSGVFDDANSAEEAARVVWERLPKSLLDGMNPSERLAYKGLL